MKKVFLIIYIIINLNACTDSNPTTNTLEIVKKDPICQMEGEFSESHVYKNKQYTFCSAHCKEMFQENPEKYFNVK